MKLCRDCGEHKKLDDFPIMVANHRRCRCRACYEKYLASGKAARKFRRDALALQKKYEEQGGKCEACGDPISLTPVDGLKRSGVIVDHDHSTGEVRGLICNSCNTQLGVLEKPELLKKLTAYLQKYKGEIHDTERDSVSASDDGRTSDPVERNGELLDFPSRRKNQRTAGRWLPHQYYN